MGTESLETVLIAGATGGTGREVVRLGGSRTLTIRALTRSPDNESDLVALGADEVVVDDLLDPNDLSAVVADVDAVISTVGTAAKAIRSGPPFVDGAGNREFVTAAADAGVDTFVMESAIGVGSEPASSLASVFNTAIGPVQKAKATAEQALRDASLNHTILRPGILTNGRRTDLITAARPGAKLWGTISRADVARLLLSAPVTPSAHNETFEIVSAPSFPEHDARIDWRMPR